MSRALCAYAVFECPALSAARRKAFLDTAVRRWAPFPDPQFHAEWVGRKAMVWAWSKAVVGTLGGGVDDDPAAATPRRILPESIFVGSVDDAGAVLLAVAEGVEGRVWRERVLVASRWWRQSPDRVEWNEFLRGSGLPAIDDVPIPEPAPLSARGWSLTGGDHLAGLALRYRSQALAAIAGLVTFSLMVPIAGAGRALWIESRIEAEIAAKDEGLQRIMRAREAAERDAARAAGLLALRPPARQSELLPAVLPLLGQNVRILEWRLPTPDSLEVTLALPNPDPLALVQAWQDSGRFRDVTADLGRSAGEVTVRGRILARPAEAAP